MSLAVWGSLAATLGSQWYSSQNQSNRIDALNEIEEEGAAAANVVREANNEVAAARGSLQRFLQSRRNQETLRAAGDQVDTISTNLARLQDDLLRSSVQTRLEAAAESGALAASAAASGVGGTSVDLVDRTLWTNQGVAQTALDRQGDQAYFDALEARAGVMEAAQTSLDRSVILDNLDFREATAAQYAQPSGLGQALNVISGTVQANPVAIREALTSFGFKG